MKKDKRLYLFKFTVILLIVIFIFNKKASKNSPQDIGNQDDGLGIEQSEYYKEGMENIAKDKLYIKLEKALLNGDQQVKLDISSFFVKSEEIFSTLEYISYENPEVMYYKGAEYSLGKVNLFYSKPSSDINAHQRTIRAIREKFFKGNIEEDMTDYEKILSIHDYIIENAQYDTRLYSDGNVPPESYSAYGVLNAGTGVCESYAKSMKYLLDRAGIESRIVIGKSRGENHAWNLVNIEGEYYHIDPTWNDPVIEGGSELVRYNFFNLNDRQMKKTHDWKEENYPESNGEKYNYYAYNNLIAEDTGELKFKLKKALLNRKPSYTIRMSKADKGVDINNIIEDIGYKNYEQVMLKGYSYYLDEGQNIFNFQFYYY